MTNQAIQRPCAEQLYFDELERLLDWDKGPKPPGWNMSPYAVEKFILGDPKLSIEKKIVVSSELITRIIVSLATNRGSMLIGKPGTAKSWLSELLAAAISGQSTLTIHGGTISEINQLLYSWNKALVNEKGPCKESLMPSPIYRAMQKGQMLRFEEIARCPQFIQDAVLSILSERQIQIPELSGTDSVLFAREGFNIIATSNSLDIGIHQMSAAMKRRMNFETIQPIPDIEDEIKVVARESEKLIQQSGVDVKPDLQILKTLVTIFHELRLGQTLDGHSTNRLAGTVMSTAEAVSVAHAMGVHAYYYRDGKMQIKDLIPFIIGTALKDNEEDQRRLKQYFNSVIANKKGEHWKILYQQRNFI